jgi:isoaspartyl peptidase/L-asparaginase-like protein (Ntn-hydrolase superfamily)
MSAAIMDGETQEWVINIEVKNPVQVAQILMQYDDRVLGGSGDKFRTEKWFWIILQKFHNVVQNMKKN